MIIHAPALYKTVKAAYITPKKTALPVLSYIRLEAVNEQVTAVMTNLTDVKAGKTRARTNDGELDAICLPARALRDWLKIASDNGDMLMITVDNPRMTAIITDFNGTKAQFKGIDAREFPVYQIPMDAPRFDWYGKPLA